MATTAELRIYMLEQLYKQKESLDSIENELGKELGQMKVIKNKIASIENELRDIPKTGIDKRKALNIEEECEFSDKDFDVLVKSLEQNIREINGDDLEEAVHDSLTELVSCHNKLKDFSGQMYDKAHGRKGKLIEIVCRPVY